jgi:hypothetical protein
MPGMPPSGVPPPDELFSGISAITYLLVFQKVGNSKKVLKKSQELLCGNQKTN